MKKRLLALLLGLILLLPTVQVAANENAVAAVDGNVTLSFATDAEEGTPVLVVILPAIFEAGIDVTAKKVETMTSTDIMTALDVEYAKIVNTGADGVLNHNAVMKDSLATGVCHVIISYLGSDGCISAGTFEHVGEDDKKAVLSAMNKADKDSYGSVINSDLNGTTENPVAKEILRKSSADVAYYKTLNESEKSEFHELLYTFKGEADFDLISLVSAFNASGVWMRLRLSEDTLAVLNTYNGDGINKYWNVEIAEGSDFASLPEDEKAIILENVKEAKYYEKESLQKAFHDDVVMGMIRCVDSREALAELISEDGKYAEDFAGVRDILEDADLDEYDLAILYNNVLDGAKNCETMEDVESLFEDSVPEEEEDKKGSSGGGGGGGKTMSASSGYKTSASLNAQNAENAENVTAQSGSFKDVAADHWAVSYIEKLSKEGAINGVGNGSFAPGAAVKRQDFVKILVGALKMELSKTASDFSDVPSGAYFEAYVMTAMEKGLVSGIGDGLFGVGADISREDAALIMSRVLKNYGISADGESAVFGDAEKIADYAKEAINEVTKAKIFSGDEKGNFNPKEKLSRAETCAIICRLAEKIKGE